MMYSTSYKLLTTEVMHIHEVVVQIDTSLRESVNSGLDYWNGLLDWTIGLTFDLTFSHENNGGICMSRV